MDNIIKLKFKVITFSHNQHLIKAGVVAAINGMDATINGMLHGVTIGELATVVVVAVRITAIGELATMAAAVWITTIGDSGGEYVTII